MAQLQTTLSTFRCAQAAEWQKMSVAEQAQFILGQLSILGVAIVVTLVELAIWLAN
jgi:hypothetical protein